MNAIDTEYQEKSQVSSIKSVSEGWDEKTLLDAVGMKRDLIVAGPFGSNLKVSDYRDKGIPIIRLQNIDYGKFIDKDIKYISPEKARELAYHSFRAGDLVLAKLGDPIGKTCIVPDYFQNGIVVADVVRIRVANGWADKKFIMYSLNSVATKNQLINGKIGSTRPRVNLDQIRDIRISVPPLNEQRKIAAILSSVDAAIVQTDAIIAQTEQMKKGLMQELFTKGIGHNAYKTTPIGKLPKDWDVRTCNSICEEIVVGIVVKPSQYYSSSGVPALRSANIRESGIDPSDLIFITEESNRILSKSMVRSGDVLTVRTGYPGTSCVATPEFDGCNCIDIIISRPKTEIISSFLAAWINSSFGKKQVLRAKSGLAQQHFNIGELKKMLVPKPSIEEQRRIMCIISVYDRRLCLEKSYLNKLKQLKKGLMQDLLTGRVQIRTEGGHA